MGDRVAIYKSLQLGDTIKGVETLTLDGESPETTASLYSDAGVIADRGAGSIYRVDLKAILLRGASSYVDYLKRRLTFLKNLKLVRGAFPNVSPFNLGTAGMLAILEDSTAYFTTTAEATVGTPRTISLSASVTVADNERWFIFDPASSVFTTFQTDASSGASVTAETLDTLMPAGSVCFRATFVLRDAFMLPGITLEGDEEHAANATKDITLSFMTNADPLFDAVVTP